MNQYEYNNSKRLLEFVKEYIDSSAWDNFYLDNPNIKPSFLNNVFYSREIKEKQRLVDEEKKRIEEENKKKEKEEAEKRYQEYIKQKEIEKALLEKQFQEKMKTRKYEPGFFSRLFSKYEKRCYKCNKLVTNKNKFKCKYCDWYICECDACKCNLERYKIEYKKEMIVLIEKKKERKNGEEGSVNVKKSRVYESHCFRCKTSISSEEQLLCKFCGWYICDKCYSCGCQYDRWW